MTKGWQSNEGGAGGLHGWDGGESDDEAMPDLS